MFTKQLAGWMVLTGLALSCGQESVATQCTINERPSFGTSVTGGTQFVDGHSERGKADTV